MVSQLRHRGPDDEGVWVDKETGIALGHRRLAILDLSHTGRQPMFSSDGRYIITYNGEVYNFQELRRRIQDTNRVKFRGSSDTEVILEAIRVWGIKKAIEKFNGMFAFAVWDRKEKKLYLARDRIGIKPLYYGWAGKSFVFSSELKALRVFRDFRGEIKKDALALYLRYNYIPTPYSIYKNIYKLELGSILEIDCEGKEKKSVFWNVKEAVRYAAAHPLQEKREAEEELDWLLRSSAKLRMISDVPLGAFLSGGIDSSTVTALMQVQSPKPIKTFTIGFYEKGYNEAEYAKKIAQYLGTEHTELYVSPKEAIAVIPKLAEIYDEPFSDSSQIPTFIISKLTRQYVTVSLSGDGGDELFGGYNRHFWIKHIKEKTAWLPYSGRLKISKALRNMPSAVWSILDKAFAGFPSKFRLSQIEDKATKISDILSKNTDFGIYHSLISHWHNLQELILNYNSTPSIIKNKWEAVELKSFTQKMQYLDLTTYLVDDILTKVDRASMSVSLEVRVPFLDHRVVEFAWRIPLEMKIAKGEGKKILKKLLSRYVPQKFMERPKMGFGVPLGQWLRGPLREWAEELLSEKRLREEEFFHPEPIRQKWREHLSGKRNWQYHLWDILMFEAWKEGNSQ